MTTITTNGAQNGSLIGSLGTAASGTSADFNMFLKLLTTQMQNQDPLDPMDTSQYTQQLVQFSQVEQSMQQTSTLKDMLGRMTSQEMAQATSFIGHEIRFDSAAAGLGADPATWSYSAPRDVSNLTATISDASGKVVHEMALTPDRAGSVSWDGKRSGGGTAAPGVYSLSIRGLDVNGAEVPITIQGIGTVRDVTLNGGVVMLGVNGAQVPLSQLLGIAAKQG